VASALYGSSRRSGRSQRHVEGGSRPRARRDEPSQRCRCCRCGPPILLRAFRDTGLSPMAPTVPSGPPRDRARFGMAEDPPPHVGRGRLLAHGAGCERPAAGNGYGSSRVAGDRAVVGAGLPRGRTRRRPPPSGRTGYWGICPSRSWGRGRPRLWRCWRWSPVRTSNRSRAVMAPTGGGGSPGRSSRTG
jgi:hypothetical protein